MEPATAHRQLEITLLQERSAGTFARVYLAEASGADGLSRIVAVKVLKEQWSESSELLDRTRDEARLLARLRHKNILRVEAMAELDGQPAIVMELVDGLDLKQLVERTAQEGGRIPPRAAYAIAQQAASALEAAYFKVPYGMADPLHVVHRDVKPSNIMVSCEGEVKVLDFGTARYQWEGRLAQTGALRFGSLKYMSPERRSGDRGDHASDIYALGLVLVEMLRGAALPLLPLETGEHDETMRQVVMALPDLGMPNDDWISSLRETLLRMCSAEPELRLDAQQVAQLLRAFTDQASGTSLDSFAADTVTRLNRAIYGGGAEGALSGSRIFVHMSAGGQEARAAQPAVPGSPGLAAVPQPSGVVPDPGASTVHELPARPGATDPFAYELPDTYDAGDGFERTPVDVDPSQELPTVQAKKLVLAPGASVTAPAVGLQPGQGQVVRPVTPTPGAMGRTVSAGAESLAPPREAERRLPHPGPEVRRREAEPFAGPTMVTRPPEASAGPLVAVQAPEPRRGSRWPLLLGAGAVGLLGVLLLSLTVGGVAAFFMLGPRSVATADPPEAPDGPEAPPPAAGALSVSIEATDGTIQWVRLLDAEGARLVNAKPQDSAKVPAGSFELQAKQAGRGKVSAALEVEADLALSCAPADKGAIRCVDEGAGRELLLKP